MSSVPHNRHDVNGNQSDESTHLDAGNTETLPKFPNWFRQLIGFGSVIVAVTIAYANIRSDVRDISTRSEQREQRLLTVEARTEKIYSDLGDIKSDVRFLRQVIEAATRKP